MIKHEALVVASTIAVGNHLPKFRFYIPDVRHSQLPATTSRSIPEKSSYPNGS